MTTPATPPETPPEILVLPEDLRRRIVEHFALPRALGAFDRLYREVWDEPPPSAG